MKLFNWSDKFVLGINDIDQQHKQLVDLINELYDARQANHTKESLSKIVKGLVAYAKTHLSYEEILLKFYNYPDLTSHKAEHLELTEKAINLQKEYLEGNEDLSTDLAILLNDWLSVHILETDKKYAEFIKEKAETSIGEIENFQDILVGIREMDNQHFAVIDIYKSIVKAKELNNEDEIMQYVSKLIELWKEHFKYEEDLMEQYKYSDLHEHQKEHKEIKDSILNLEKMYSKGFSYVVSNLSLQLNHWIVEHIRHINGKDKELGAFLNSKGVT